VFLISEVSKSVRPENRIAAGRAEVLLDVASRRGVGRVRVTQAGGGEGRVSALGERLKDLRRDSSVAGHRRSNTRCGVVAEFEVGGGKVVHDVAAKDGLTEVARADRGFYFTS